MSFGIFRTIQDGKYSVLNIQDGEYSVLFKMVNNTHVKVRGQVTDQMAFTPNVRNIQDCKKFIKSENFKLISFIKRNGK